MAMNVLSTQIQEIRDTLKAQKSSVEDISRERKYLKTKKKLYGLRKLIMLIKLVCSIKFIGEKSEQTLCYWEFTYWTHTLMLNSSFQFPYKSDYSQPT